MIRKQYVFEERLLFCGLEFFSHTLIWKLKTQHSNKHGNILKYKRVIMYLHGVSQITRSVAHFFIFKRLCRLHPKPASHWGAQRPHTDDQHTHCTRAGTPWSSYQIRRTYGLLSSNTLRIRSYFTETSWYTVHDVYVIQVSWDTHSKKYHTCEEQHYALETFSIRSNKVPKIYNFSDFKSSNNSF